MINQWTLVIYTPKQNEGINVRLVFSFISQKSYCDMTFNHFVKALNAM